MYNITFERSQINYSIRSGEKMKNSNLKLEALFTHHKGGKNDFSNCPDTIWRSLKTQSNTGNSCFKLYNTTMEFV